MSQYLKEEEKHYGYVFCQTKLARKPTKPSLLSLSVSLQWPFWYFGLLFWSNGFVLQIHEPVRNCEVLNPHTDAANNI